MADLFDIVVARKLSGGGGGGSSDFSTATVTVENFDGGAIDVHGAFYRDEVPSASFDGWSLTDGVYTFILYKGLAEMYIDYDPEYHTISGNITMDGSIGLATGNFTISYNGQ